MIEVPQQEIDAVLAGIVLADKTIPDYYWEYRQNHDIPQLWVAKYRYYIDVRKEITEYYLKISYRHHSRAKIKYVEWPRIVFFNTHYMNVYGILVEHKFSSTYDYVADSNRGWKWVLKEGIPEKEYVILATETGKAKYMKAFPSRPEKQSIWKLVEYEGTVK